MPLFNDAISVPERDVTPATSAALTGDDVADVDFTGDDYNATLVVDGGSDQSIVLDADYTDFDGLVTELNSQTTGATWSHATGTLTVTSDTDGATSEISWEVTLEGTKTLSIADDDVFGEDEIVDDPTMLYISTTGTTNSPQQLLILNNEDSSVDDAPSVAIGGPDVEYDEAPLIKPGASMTIPLEAGEAVFATADTGQTVDVRILVTRH
jgi:hypothetical protein